VLGCLIKEWCTTSEEEARRGEDAVFLPLHRVYGARRLDLLLRGFRVAKEEFWSKRPGLNVWTQVSRQEALATQASETFYSLGLFVLQPDLGEDG
jgi:hypothetical protein